MPRKSTPVIKAAPWGGGRAHAAGELCLACAAAPSVWHLCRCQRVSGAAGGFPRCPPALLAEFLQTRAAGGSIPFAGVIPQPGRGGCPSLPSRTSLRADVCLFLSLSPSSCSFLLPLFTFFFHLLPSVLLTSGYFGLSFSLSVW